MLEGKKGLIVGIANHRSIAWAIAKTAAAAGAQLALTYQNERLGGNVRELAAELKDPLLLECDATNDAHLEALGATVKERFGTLDFLVHSIAFAQREDLSGEFVHTSREGYRLANDISSYSLTALTRAVLPLMEEHGGSIVAMTYLGSERVIPKYNVMGVAKAALEASVRYLAYDLGPRNIRVNAISAGPIRTLAASGVAGLPDMLKYHRDRAPLRRNTETSEVADTALFLVSHLSRGITGEVIFVDSGFHILGM